MPDSPQFTEFACANPLVLALEITSAALLHDNKDDFLRSALAAIGEALHCGQVTLTERQDGHWHVPATWQNPVQNPPLPDPALDDLAPVLEAFDKRKSLVVENANDLPEGPLKKLFTFRQVLQPTVSYSA